MYSTAASNQISSFQPDCTLLLPTPLTTVLFPITHVYPIPQQCFILVEQVYRVDMSPLLAHGRARSVHT
jgi:hypothetical protein